MAEHRKPGRPSKGPRERIDLRVSPALKAAIEKAAAEQGMHVNDFVGELCAASTGVPYSQQTGVQLLPVAS